MLEARGLLLLGAQTGAFKKTLRVDVWEVACLRMLLE